MSERLDWLAGSGFYAIVDPDHCAGRDPLAVARALLAGGCAVLQLRAKRLNDREHVELAGVLKTVCASTTTPFVVNDRADIAVLVDADGLHLGQDDMPIGDARTVVGSMPIGVSTHSAVQAAAARRDGADLIGFGPVFATGTKENPDPVVGVDGLAEVCAAARVPVVAIGGMTPENAGQAHAAGARFIASIRAVTAQDDVEATARAMSAVYG